MGKLRRLRTRFISSIGAVRRSVLRRQSQSTSTTTSNPTTLTRLASLDSAVPSRTRSRGSRAQKRKVQVRQEQQEQEQLQLHWNEARRIYSEPVQAIQSLSREEENRSSTGTTITDCRSLSCGAIQEQYSRKNAGTESSCDSAQAELAGTQISDDEDDDVFLQSWEERRGYRSREEDFFIGDGNSLSDVSSGYSTISNDNLPSPALYLPPPSGDEGGLSSEELDQREGGISGWDDWRIPESEITLGTLQSSTERETIYSGYWHGSVQVRSRKVREVEDLIYFLDEVTTLSCIRHENIQLFMGACLSMQQGTLAIVMSEIKGDTLHTRLHNYGHAFTNSSKIKILRQIAEGMEYLHGRGIPHGLLSSHSISLHYRVCISLAPQYSRSNARQLEPHKFPYLPPECVRELCASRCRSRDPSCDLDECGRRRVHSCGDEVCGVRAPMERRACMVQLKGRPTLSADIFAFGTIIYELMLLEYPYKCLPLETQIWRVGRGDLQELTLIPKGRLRSVIWRCWVESPQSRPSFKELLATIEQDVSGPYISKSPLRPSFSLPCLSSPPTFVTTGHASPNRNFT